MAKTFGVTFAIGAKVNPTVASAFATVEQKIRASQSKMRELTEKAKVLAAANEAKQRVVAAQKVLAQSGGRDPIAREVFQNALASFNKATAAAKKYGVAVADIGRIHAQTDRALAQTEKRLQALNRAQAYKERRQEAAESIRAAAIPALALAAPISEAIKFESAMASAAKTIDGMRDDSGKLTAQYYEMEAAIKQMGQSLPLTHDELAKLFAAGGQQGMTAVSDLREFTTMAAQMAVAFDMSTEQAADAIGGYRSALNLTMPEARSLLDLMNQYANTTSASEKGIADVVRRVGSLGAVGGVAAKPVTALAATLDAMKVAPEVAATGIKNLILAMTAGSAATKSQKAAFASLGIDAVKLAKQMQVDGPAAIISVLEAVQKLPKASQLSTMQQIFGKESLGSIAPLLANLDKVRQNLITCGDESAYAGAMQKEFDNVSGTTANKLILLKNRLQEVGITVAGALLPAIHSITETIGPPLSAVAKFAGEHKNLTTAAIGVAGALVGLKIGAAAVMWCVSGFAGAFNLAKAAIGGFSAVTRIAAGVQTVFNAAMVANPVGIVVVAVGALVAGLVYLYNTCEPVRAAFDGAFTWIGEKVRSVAAFVEGLFGKITSGIQTVKSGWKTVKSLFGFGGDEEAGAPEVKAPEIQTAAKPAQVPQEALTLLYGANGMPMPQAVAQPEVKAPAAKAQTPKAQPVIVPKTAQEKQAPQAQPVAEKPTPAKAVSAPENSQPKQPAPAQAPPAPQPDFAAMMARMQEALKSSSTSSKGGSKSASAPAKPDTQIVQPQVQVSVNVTQNGIPEQSFANGVMSAIRNRQGELEKIISGIFNEQARLAYG